MRIAINAPRVGRECRHYRVLDVDAVEWPLSQGLHPAVDANGWRGSRDEQEIAAAAPGEQAQPSLDSGEVAGRVRLRPGGVELENQPVDLVVVRHIVPTAAGACRAAL